MKDNKTDSFVFYRSYYSSIGSLKKDSDKWELLDIICAFALDGEIKESKTDYINSLFQAHKFNIQASLDRRETNRINGAKGGAPEGNQNARKQPKTTENNLNANVNADGNDYLKMNDNYDDKNNEEEEEEDKDKKDNGVIKGKKKRSILNLKPSDLEYLFPGENINVITEYYDSLKNSNFYSDVSKKTIKSIDELIEDFGRRNK